MSLIQRFIPLALPVALLGTLAGCSHHSPGPITTQVRYAAPVTSENVPTSGSFSRIVLRGAIDVVVREGGATAVSVTGDPSIHERLKTKVDGDTLVIDLASKTCIGLCFSVDDEDPRVTVDLPSLRAATLEGSGDLRVEGKGAHAEVDIDVEGSGDVHYNGSADVLRLKVEGSGDVVLRGAGKRLETVVDGSGDVNAARYPVTGGTYELDGSGDVTTVMHGGDVSVQIHGSGDLVYSGEMRITSLDVSGSGEMRQVGAGASDDSDGDSDSE